MRPENAGKGLIRPWNGRSSEEVSSALRPCLLFHPASIASTLTTEIFGPVFIGAQVSAILTG